MWLCCKNVCSRLARCRRTCYASNEYERCSIFKKKWNTAVTAAGTLQTKTEEEQVVFFETGSESS